MGPIELAAATYLKEPTQVTRSALEAALVARISQSHRYVVLQGDLGFAHRDGFERIALTIDFNQDGVVTATIRQLVGTSLADGLLDEIVGDRSASSTLASRIVDGLERVRVGHLETFAEKDGAWGTPTVGWKA